MRGARRLGALAAGIALAGAACPPGAAALETATQSGPVEVRVRLEPDAPVIGDAMQLGIEVVAEPDVEVLMPDFGEALDRFRVVDFVPRDRIGDDGRIHASQRYTLQAPASGAHRVPSIRVEFVDRRPGRDPAPEGADAYEVLTDPIPFEVASVVPDSATAELHPPLGRLEPLDAPGPGRGLLLGGALGLLAAAGGIAAWVLHRIRSRAGRRSAYEVARAELDALLASPTPTGPEIDAFFVALSGIVRRYLEARFAIRSPELTTERFLEVLSDSPDLTDDHQALLRDFLRECDLVKFAHVIPGEEDTRKAVAAARLFLEETGEPADADGDRAGTREVAE